MIIEAFLYTAFDSSMNEVSLILFLLLKLLKFDRSAGRVSSVSALLSLFAEAYGFKKLIPNMSLLNKGFSLMPDEAGASVFISFGSVFFLTAGSLK